MPCLWNVRHCCTVLRELRMGFINTVSELFKDSMKPKLDWRKNADGVSRIFSGTRTKAAIAIDVDDTEFLQRYKNVRFSSASALTFMTISFVSIPTATTMLGLFTSILASTLFFLFYFRYAYLMWVCRDSWRRGINLESIVTSSMGNYLKNVWENPAELLPLALPEKGSTK